MKSKIIWSKKSKTSLIEIKEYFTENASPRIANRLVKEIINKAQLLLETPFAGQKIRFLNLKIKIFDI
jgi:plasmid stabilization system protein ParE